MFPTHFKLIEPNSAVLQIGQNVIGGYLSVIAHEIQLTMNQQTRHGSPGKNGVNKCSSKLDRFETLILIKESDEKECETTLQVIKINDVI